MQEEQFTKDFKVLGYVTFLIGLIMLNNIEHIAYEHYLLSHKVFPEISFFGLSKSFDFLNKAHSIFTVIVVELSIIFFAIKGEKAWVLFSTFLIFIFNISYYNLIADFSVLPVQEIIVKVSFSLFYTVSIYIFSDILAKKLAQKKYASELESTIEQRKAYLEQLGAEASKHRVLISEIEQLKKDREQAEALLQKEAKEIEQARASLHKEEKVIEQVRAGLENERAEISKELACPNCDKQFDSQRGVNAHKGTCKIVK